MGRAVKMLLEEGILLMMNVTMKVMGNVLEGINQCWTVTQMDLSSARTWQLVPFLLDSAQGEVRGIVFAQCAVRKPFRPAGHTAAVQVCRAQGPQFQWVNHRTPEGCGLAGTLKII